MSKTPHILACSGKKSDITTQIQKINSRNSYNYDSNSIDNKDKMVYSEEVSNLSAIQAKTTDVNCRSKSGVGNQDDVPSIHNSKARDSKTARTKWRKSKAPQVPGFNQKCLPEFKLTSEFNWRQALKKSIDKNNHTIDEQVGS